ncbi:UNVERIFIED_CONTAM: hypothetical protein PYX00_002506 [Menopon gallinae]|uniref:Programmed cell death protein 7 n=1 Tax=Menopon gallinae TaxID=328185 RepID=A0AAW2IH99_9NEOP
MRENVCNPSNSSINTPCNSSFYPNSEVNALYIPQNHYSAFEDDQKQKDEEYICSFVSTKGKRKFNKNHSPLKIFQARNYLIEIKSLKNELEKESELLDVNSGDFDEKWKTLLVKQNKINDLLSRFNENVLNSLKTKLQKRKKKRNWHKKRQEELKIGKKEREDSIKAKHTLIDKILSEKSKEVESMKRKEALTRQADTVLHEVRRKKYEARKMLNLLLALLKLRELRSKQEIAQGGYCSQQVTETFNGVIKHFQELWTKQSERYNLEEKGLRVMLEESEIPQVKIPAFQNILNQWEQAFFGSPTTDKNCRYLTQADYDADSLIFIR